MHVSWVSDLTSHVCAVHNCCQRPGHTHELPLDWTAIESLTVYARHVTDIRSLLCSLTLNTNWHEAGSPCDILGSGIDLYPEPYLRAPPTSSYLLGPSTLNIEAVCSSETSLNPYRTARRNIPEAGTLPNHSCRNIEPRNGILVLISARCLLHAAFLRGATLQPWRWRRHVSAKHQLTFIELHGVIFQKIELFAITYSRNVGWLSPDYTALYSQFYFVTSVLEEFSLTTSLQGAASGHWRLWQCGLPLISSVSWLQTYQATVCRWSRLPVTHCWPQ
jgi:hypothetical protein